VWSDSKGRLWVSEWNTGNLSVYAPAAKNWTVFKLPGEAPQAYAVYVDDKDKVWVSDFGANAIVEFDLVTERFEAFRATGKAPRCVSSTGARAKCGAQSQAPTAWW
jgi:virginiamycin B lyase